MINLERESAKQFALAVAEIGWSLFVAALVVFVIVVVFRGGSL